MLKTLIDETGKCYGALTVIEPMKEVGMKKTHWKCKCACGREILVTGSDLRTGKRTSCGKRCNNIIKEIPGTIYGYLKVIERDKTPASNFADNTIHWWCECQLCGTKKSISGKSLRNGDTKSCGCLESIGERLVAKALQELGYTYKKEYTFPDLKREKTKQPYRFDFAIFDDNNNLFFIIEYNGCQHFQEDKRTKDTLEERQDRDNIKDNYCCLNHISRIYFNHRNQKFIGTYDEIKNEIEKFYNELKEIKNYVKVLDYNF